ncbi:phosphatidate cytidylyltransferase [Bdellovibrio sp. HCB337]|uniref:phosphatidate cytidylyltransferase n=1 Tax=Bdellovibrio sp. HCB337 TaxID=3394358 RepID=UPI0039A4B480
MTKTFITRTLSALVALILLFAAYYFLQVPGIKLVCYLLVLIGGYELINILLPKNTGKFHKGLFYTVLILIFHVAANYPAFAVVAFSLATVLFLVLSLLWDKAFTELDSLVQYHAKSVLGFVYLGLLPSYAYRLLELNNGLIWFLTLLAVVFAGDIGAYVVGVLIGKHKINPRLSPKKTWEGAFGGLLGSTIAGYVCSQFLPQIPLNALLVTAICAGFVAQFGDFFESLMKRVADVKDSGKIMPGHGGVLDRIDGVLFASPVIMMVASLFESY